MEDLTRRTVGPAVQLEVVGAGGLWLTKVDQSQLENAVLNLSINARDAMPTEVASPSRHPTSGLTIARQRRASYLLVSMSASV